MLRTKEMVYGAESVSSGQVRTDDAAEWPEPKPLSGTLAEVPVFDPELLPELIAEDPELAQELEKLAEAETKLGA